MRCLLALLLLWPSSLFAQGSIYTPGSVLTIVSATPAACRTNDVVIVTTTPPKLQVCTATNTWSTLGMTTGMVPTNAIVYIDAGTCATTLNAGWTEVSEISGRMVRGTVAANMDVGGTGGADSVTPTFTGNSVASSAVSAGTPAGTNNAPALTMNSYTPAGTNGAGTVTPLGTIAWPAGVPAFTGAALAAHAHELPWQIPSTTTIRQIAVATFGTGTSRAATAVSAAGVANTTAAAVALSESKSAGTPAGTVAWPAGVPTLSGASSTTSAQTFTGTAATLTGSVAAPAFTGSALGTHQHTTAATGTISAVDTRAAYVKLIACKRS